MPLDPRVEFHRVVIKSKPSHETNVSETQNNGFLRAYSTGGQRSSRASSLYKANGLVKLPSLSNSRKCLDKNELATALVIGEIEME